LADLFGFVVEYLKPGDSEIKRAFCSLDMLGAPPGEEAHTNKLSRSQAGSVSSFGYCSNSSVAAAALASPKNIQSEAAPFTRPPDPTLIDSASLARSAPVQSLTKLGLSSASTSIDPVSSLDYPDAAPP